MFQREYNFLMDFVIQYFKSVCAETQLQQFKLVQLEQKVVEQKTNVGN